MAVAREFDPVVLAFLFLVFAISRETTFRIVSARDSLFPSRLLFTLVSQSVQLQRKEKCLLNNQFVADSCQVVQIITFTTFYLLESLGRVLFTEINIIVRK